MKKIQLKPVGSMFTPIDKLPKKLFTVGLDAFNFNETKKIKSKVRLESPKGQLTPFDGVVLNAICSTYRAGNEIISLNSLWRLMGGSHNLHAAMKEKLLNSIEKLRLADVVIDMTEINAKCKYPLENKIRNYLLPCNVITAKINGQTTDFAIEILDEPPLLKISEGKKQFVRLKLEAIQVSKLKYTENNIVILNYLSRRVLEIKGSKNRQKNKYVKELNNSITFEKLLNDCGLSDLSGNRQGDIRNAVAKILSHFVKVGVIDSFEVKKSGGKYHSVKIFFK